LKYSKVNDMKKSVLAVLALLVVAVFPVLVSAQTVYPKYNKEVLENPYVYYPYTLKNLTNRPVVVYVYWSKEFKLKYELDAQQQTKDLMLPLWAKVRVDAYVQKSSSKGAKPEKVYANPYVNYDPKFDRGWEIGYSR